MLSIRIRIYAELGDVAKAEADLARLAAIDPEGDDTVGSRGLVLLAVDDVARARRAFESAAQLESSWWFWVGVALLLSGNAAEALEAYRKGLAGTDNGALAKLVALHDLEHYLARRPPHPSNLDVVSAVQAIGDLLRS